MSTHLNFGVQLPIEICDEILSYLDGFQLLNVCHVCKELNNHISNSTVLWRRACINSGFDVRKSEGVRDANNWKQFHRVMTERMQQMKTLACFREEEIELHPEGPSYLYYYKGKIAVVSPLDEIDIWDCAVNSYALHIKCRFHPSNLKFDDRVIIAAGYIKYTYENVPGLFVSWNATDALIINQYSKPSRNDFMSFDFSTDSNIVVSRDGASNLDVWNLLTGANIKTVSLKEKMMLPSYSDNIMLTPNILENTSGLKRHFIFIIDDPNILDDTNIQVWVLNITSNVLSAESLTVDKVSEVDYGYLLPTLHFDGRFLRFVQSPGSNEYTTILTWDTEMNCVSSKININMKKAELLGIGKKYLVMLENCNVAILRILQNETYEEISLFQLPRTACKLKSNSHIMVGEKSWLDGLDGENDQGVVFTYGNNGTLHIWKWIPRFEE